MGWFFPEHFQKLNDLSAVYLLIFILFFINGYLLELKKSDLSLKLGLSFIILSSVSLVICPVLLSYLIKNVNLSHSLLDGILIMSAVPTTLSSGIVITEISRGKQSWALYLTVGMNLLGIMTLPFVLSFILKKQDILLPTSELLFKLLVLVLIPIITGYSLKKILEKPTNQYLSTLPSLCVLCTIAIFIGSSKDSLQKLNYQDLPAVLLICVMIHCTLLIVVYLTSKLLHLSCRELKGVLFVGSQKTLPLAMTILAILFADPGLYILPCLCFHFFQLIFDSFIASRMVSTKN